jgi:hypothetical protein
MATPDSIIVGELVRLSAKLCANQIGKSSAGQVPTLSDFLQESHRRGRD